MPEKINPSEFASESGEKKAAELKRRPWRRLRPLFAAGDICIQTINVKSKKKALTIKLGNNWMLVALYFRRT